MPSMDIVVTRFRESWDDILDLHRFALRVMNMDAFRMIVYNRGDPFEIDISAPSNILVKESENIGREAYVILQHIYENYDDLPAIVAFIPASWRSSEMKKESVAMIMTYFNRKPFVPVSGESVQWERVYNTTLDGWLGNTPENKEAVAKQTYTLSDIRPYGEWYKKRILETTGREWQRDENGNGNITYFGIFCTHRTRIYRYSKEQYLDWLEEMKKKGANTELAHYWEWSWAALFS